VAKLSRKIEEGNELAKKAGKHKSVLSLPSNKGWVELYPQIQRTLSNIENLYINSIEFLYTRKFLKYRSRGNIKFV